MKLVKRVTRLPGLRTRYAYPIFLDIVAIQLRYSPMIIDEAALLSVPIGLNVSITIVALNSSPTTHIRCRGLLFRFHRMSLIFHRRSRTIPLLV